MKMIAEAVRRAIIQVFEPLDLSARGHAVYPGQA